MSEKRTLLTVAELERINQMSQFGAHRVSNMLARAAVVADDHDNAKRLEAHECRFCFYLGRGALAGQAFTSWKCGLCGAEGQHANTAVPRVCRPCAEGFGLCVTCGGDIQHQHRTRRFGRKRRRQ